MPEAARAPLTYAAAGVDISAGDEAVERIKASVESTRTPGVLSGIGGFGGLFALQPGRWRDPVLVSSTDGVGTKAMVASRAGVYDTIGIDLVAMVVDDLACQGAEPLFLLDYLAVGRLEPDLAALVVEGVAEGCRRAGCALLGGEMAEHPGAMPEGDFDLAGFAVGAVERDAILGPERVRPGDVLVGIASPGLRCNGYSLARRVLLDDGADLHGPAWPGAGRTLAEELLEPSVVYAPGVLRAAAAAEVHAVAHITGGGIPGNVVRVLPPGVDAVIRRGSWDEPRIFDEIRRRGPVEEDEMLRTFNCGLGMVAAVAAGTERAAIDALAAAGHAAWVVGRTEAGSGRVRVEA